MSSAVQGVSPQRKKIHPHKFAMWLAMGSISMMFAGLTSAYIVRESQGNWRYFKLPSLFYVSTGVIILSSVTYHFCVKAFKDRKMGQFRGLLVTTALLGVLFGVMQGFGFYQLYHVPQQVAMNHEFLNESKTIVLQGNPSESFLFIITGLHLLHILGGVIALLITLAKAYWVKVKVYSTTGLEVVGAYWHFVDILWIYLFIFFLANQ